MIHPTAIIRGPVDIHDTAIVEPYAVITGPAQIGARAYIGAHSVIGAPAQHDATAPAPRAAARDGAGVIIGADACVREFCTIHQGLMQQTRVGNDTLLMAGCHIAHDAIVGPRATLGSFTLLGGFTMIGSDVTFGQGVVTHPWVAIGGGSMIGLNTSVIRDVEPYAKVAGSPAREVGANTRKLDTTDEKAIDDEFARLCADRDLLRDAWYAAAASSA